MISICFNDVCSRDYGEFTVIYDLRNKTILKLESVAADIWNYIYDNKEIGFDNIVDYVQELYDCDDNDIVEDIEDFLNELYDSGVIKVNKKYTESINNISENTKKRTDDFEGSIIQELQVLNQLYSVTFEMTYACNEKCIHCYAHNDEPNSTIKTLPIDTYKNMIDQLYEMNCMHISFTGGDPFMYPNFIEVYRYARKKGFVCDIFTNALYLADNDSIMDEIIISRPRAFYISLYGATAKTHDSVTRVQGSFEKTMRAVRYLKSKDISVVFNIMILSVNHTETEQIIELTENMGVEYRVSMSLIYTNSGSDSPMNYFVNKKEDIKKVLKIARKNLYSFDISADDIKMGEYMCGAGITSLSVSPTGDIYPCISLKNKLGNLETDSIKTVWFGDKRLEVLTSLKWDNTDECKNCQYQNNCPHCPGISQAETGDCFSCNTCDHLIAECLSEL